MKQKHDLLGILLAAVTGVLLLALVIIRTCFPRIILPEFDFSMVLLLSLVALVSDHYFVRGSRRDYRLLPLYAALIFGVFPLASLAVFPLDALKLALIGAVTFTVVTYLFDAMVDRLADVPIAKAAPALGAFGIYLAAQCLIGMI